MDIFIINLSYATKRKEAMIEQFSSMPEGYNLKFFNAINAKQNQHLNFKQYSKLRTILFKGKELSSGEIGCFASHFCLWEECIRQDKPILVLEDDISLEKSFWEKLKAIESCGFSYVRLMYLHNKAKGVNLSGDFELRFDGVAGTQGYYLTPKAAKAFIAKAKKWFCCVDDYMDMFYLHNVPVIAIAPHIIKEIDTQTCIHNRESKPPRYLKIVREISRLIFQLRKGIYLLCFKSKMIKSLESALIEK